MNSKTILLIIAAITGLLGVFLPLAGDTLHGLIFTTLSLLIVAHSKLDDILEKLNNE